VEVARGGYQFQLQEAASEGSRAWLDHQPRSGCGKQDGASRCKSFIYVDSAVSVCMTKTFFLLYWQAWSHSQLIESWRNSLTLMLPFWDSSHQCITFDVSFRLLHSHQLEHDKTTGRWWWYEKVLLELIPVKLCRNWVK
jgi:hypothetical protein